MQADRCDHPSNNVGSAGRTAEPNTTQADLRLYTPTNGNDSLPVSSSAVPSATGECPPEIAEPVQPSASMPALISDPPPALGSGYIGKALEEFPPAESQAKYDEMARKSSGFVSSWNFPCVFTVGNLTLENGGQPWWITEQLTLKGCSLSDSSCVDGILHIMKTSPRGPAWGDLIIWPDGVDDASVPLERRTPIHETCTRYLAARYNAAVSEGCTALSLHAIHALVYIAVYPILLPLVVGSRVRLHGMKTSELNGALCEVRQHVVDDAGLSRYGLQVIEPAAAAAKYSSVISVKASSCSEPSDSDAHSCKFARQSLISICCSDPAAKNRIIAMMLLTHALLEPLGCIHDDSLILLASQTRLMRLWNDILDPLPAGDVTGLASQQVSGDRSSVSLGKSRRLRYFCDNFQSLAQTFARDLFWMGKINHPEAETAQLKLFMSSCKLLFIIFQGAEECSALRLTPPQTEATLVLCELLCGLFEEGGNRQMQLHKWHLETLVNTCVGPWLQKALPPNKLASNHRYARIKLFQGLHLSFLFDFVNKTRKFASSTHTILRCVVPTAWRF